MPSRAACRKAAITRSSSSRRLAAKSMTLTRHSSRLDASATKRSISATASGSADCRKTANSPWASLDKCSVIDREPRATTGRALCPLRGRAHHVGSARPVCNRKKPKCRGHSPLCDVEAIGAGRGAGEQRELFVARGAGSEALEGVPQSLVADRHFVHREIALEHAAGRSEQLDAGLDIGPPNLSDRLGGGRHWRAVKIVASAAVDHAAELDDDIGTGGQLGHRPLPIGENLVASAGIGAVAERTADMPHDDRRRRKGARQIDDIGELRVVEPGVEAEPQRRQPFDPGAEIRPLTRFVVLVSMKTVATMLWPVLRSASSWSRN